MSTKTEQVHAVTTPPLEVDYSVKPANLDNAVHVDGLIDEASSTLSEHGPSSSDFETSSVSDKADLGSPFHSPKSVVQDVRSDTSMEEGEISEDALEAVEEGNGDMVAGADEGLDLDEKEAIGVDAEAVSEPKIPHSTIIVTEDAEIHGNAEDDLLALSAVIDSSTITAPPTNAAKDEPANAAAELSQHTQESTSQSSLATDADNDAAISDGQETIVDAVEPPQHARSVPPHLRLPTVREPGTQNSQHLTTPTLPPRYSDFPRASRHQFVPGANFNHRPDGNVREELARTSAQLMKARNELDAERKKSATMRQTVSAEQEKAMENALSVMTAELLKKQAKLLAYEAKVEARERDLEYRQARILQLEVYLSEGQKQVYRYQNGEIDASAMQDINREHDRLEAELQAQKVVADSEARVRSQLQHLQIREAALQMREDQYKALIRSNFEAEKAAVPSVDMEAKLDEVGEIEYNRGFGAGRVAGRAEAEENARQKGFQDGYAACQRAQITLSKLRQGLIPRDSPELDFLYDAAHPQNLFVMGARMGEGGKGKMLEVARTQQREVEPVVQKMEVEKVEEPVRRLPPPPRVTFASELRGAQNMHNGHFVLANGSGPSSPALRMNSGVNGGTRDLSAGRPIIQYENDGEPSLIDLY